MAENLAAMLQLATLYGDDEWFLTALSAFGESDDMFLLWSACALTRGDFDIAESKLMQMSAVAQTSRDWLYLRAMVLFERRQLRAAESAFKLLLRRYPSFSAGHCLYANCLAELDKKEVAEKHWEDALALSGNMGADCVSAHYFYALWLHANAMSNLSVFHLKECVRLDEAHWNSRFVLACILKATHKDKEAERHLKAICDAYAAQCAERDEREVTMAQNVEAEAEAESGSEREGVSVSEVMFEARAWQPTHEAMVYHKHYADCLVAIGEKQLAVDKYTESLKLLKVCKAAMDRRMQKTAPSVVVTNTETASPTEAEAEPERSEESAEAEKSTSTVALRCECQQGLAMCDDALGAEEQLRRFYRSFEVDTRVSLASCLSRCKSLKSAHSECEKVLRLCGAHVEALFRFASILSNLKRYKRAEALFVRCLEATKEKHGKCWNNYGVMKLNQFLLDDAMRFFKRALTILRHDPDALREVQKNIDLCRRKQKLRGADADTNADTNAAAESEVTETANANANTNAEVIAAESENGCASPLPPSPPPPSVGVSASAGSASSEVGMGSAKEKAKNARKKMKNGQSKKGVKAKSGKKAKR